MFVITQPYVFNELQPVRNWRLEFFWKYLVVSGSKTFFLVVLQLFVCFYLSDFWNKPLFVLSIIISKICPLFDAFSEQMLFSEFYSENDMIHYISRLNNIERPKSSHISPSVCTHLFRNKGQINASHVISIWCLNLVRNHGVKFKSKSFLLLFWALNVLLLHLHFRQWAAIQRKEKGKDSNNNKKV